MTRRGTTAPEPAKNRRIPCRAIAACLTGLAIAGCASISPMTNAYGYSCAWCKAEISSTYVVRQIADPIFGIPFEYEVWRGPVDGGQFLGRVKTKQEVRELINRTPEPNDFRADGAHFCSLKCVNAYKASQGIREQRVRIIEGE